MKDFGVSGNEEGYIRCDIIVKGDPVPGNQWYWYEEDDPAPHQRAWMAWEMLRYLRWVSRGFWP